VSKKFTPLVRGPRIALVAAAASVAPQSPPVATSQRRGATPAKSDLPNVTYFICSSFSPRCFHFSWWRPFSKIRAGNVDDAEGPNDGAPDIATRVPAQRNARSHRHGHSITVDARGTGRGVGHLGESDEHRDAEGGANLASGVDNTSDESLIPPRPCPGPP